jgi:AcrR family transcriptional regulator
MRKEKNLAPPGRRRVDTDAVIAAAVQVVDRDGLDALTIRAVAQACGLSPMGVYRHVRDKDDLLDQMVDSIVGPALAKLEATGPWDERVAELFRSARRENLLHPGVATLCVLRPTSVLSAARFYSRVLAALAEGGLEGPQAAHALDTLLMFMFGSVLWQIPRSDSSRETLVAVATHDQSSAIVGATAQHLSDRKPDEYFEAGLTMILDGIRAQVRQPKITTRRTGGS